MSEELLREIIYELGTIRSKIANETAPSIIEQKLDTVIDLMTKQNEISDRIADSLENISGNIPRESGISTDKIERYLERIWEKMDDLS
jgi:hypothetical protein